ncbi:MAG: rhomboid family intramembrane serine protease [Phycisphaera sp.]|nr:rhomboid family intramembrane serine protease [Phycisphaera sp.]
MFFFPIRSDRPLKRTPWVNRALILINIVVFVLTDRFYPQEQWARFMLMPSYPHWWQFITYQFLHAGLLHVAGNMLFLYVFGNNVEDRFGHVAYLLFYLTGGVVAGIGHSLLDTAPVLGASGSVCAVTGAFLALFPLTNITIAYWFFFIGAFEVSGFLLILLQFGENLVLSLMHSGGVAYMAHLSGYLMGFAVGMGLLFSRLIPREPYDLLSLAERRRRREQFKALTRQGYQPWEAGAKTGTPTKGAAPKINERDRELMAARSQVQTLVHNRDLAGAAERYLALLALDPGQVMPEQTQLDLANQLMHEGKHEQAAHAYELFVNNYPRYAHREQVELMLALLHARYLGRKQRAKELLTSALPRLSDPQQVELAKRTLAEIG